jgi:hypothetical protein
VDHPAPPVRVSESDPRHLWRGLFDDAALYPPTDAALKDAVRDHVRHRLSWYADMLGEFVCPGGRLVALDQQAAAAGLRSITVSVVVHEGFVALRRALADARACSRVTVSGVELPLGAPLNSADVARAATFRTAARAVYVELPAGLVTDTDAHRLADAGLRLKLRTGSTSIDQFVPESELARALVMCAAERLDFKCTAGLHGAVRHHDPLTLREHHGFLNVMLACLTAATTGNVEGTRAVLAERDSRELVGQVQQLAARQVAAIRGLLARVSTRNVRESVAELLRLELIDEI